MATGITAIGCSVPARVVTNDELSRRVDTSDEWIVSHTGIRERRIVAEGEAASDLAVEAAQVALRRRGIAADDIDMIIVATSSGDYPFPATACIVQHRLGCSRAAAFDLAAGCTGFVYAFETARAFIDSGGARRILVIGSEVLTSITNWSDRNSCVLFGDAAGAVVIESLDERPGHRIVRSWLRSDGSGELALLRPVGGSRTPFDPEKHGPEDMQIRMDGRKVYLFAVDAIVRTIQELCARHGIAPSDLDWIVPHQANLRIIEAAAKRLALPVERFYVNMERYANTSAASIPLALDEMIERGLVHRGEWVLVVGFGAGLTYGGNLIEW